MAAVSSQGLVITPENTKFTGVRCTKNSKYHLPTQSDVQTLVNEVKSMSETINILVNELKYESANKGAMKSLSTYSEKLKSNPNQCDKCAQRESQLQAALDELNSVKLINNILHEEIKSLTQTPHGVSRDINPWTATKPRKSTATRTLKTAYTPSDVANSCQYTDLTTNRFAALTSCEEPQQPNSTTSSSDLMQPSRGKTNNRYGKDRQWKKSPTTKQRELPTTQIQVNPNLPKPKKKEDTASTIPTIVNGARSANSNLKHKREDSVPTNDTSIHLISKLSDSACSTRGSTPSLEITE